MTKILELKDIHVTFEKGTANMNHVLKGLNFSAQAGDFITVIGGNGAGKSTVLNSIAGVFPVDSGQVLIDKIDVTNKPEHKRASLIGRVFQDPRLGTAVRMTIEENLAIAMKRGQGRGLSYGISHSLRENLHKQVKSLGLGLEDRMKTEMGLLSGGQRQAVTLLMATLLEPKILLLDEHTAALDPKTAEQVLEITDKIINDKHMTTLMITHNMHDALRMGNRLIMLHEGRIVVDLNNEEKAKATVEDLIHLFKENSGSFLEDDQILLG